jgi:hypothetical protein
VVEHRRVETICEDAYWRTRLPVFHLSNFEENSPICPYPEPVESSSYSVLMLSLSYDLR